jgi:glucosamine--fructose-6-phosphate aminotransferase (isomerizing)
MCGIIGILSQRNVVPDLLDCLKRLEYRGYDSAGIAVIHDGAMVRCRSEGKIHNLMAKATQEKIQGMVGIGHTRWATHGVPSERNAHPHANEYVAVVHNGIIENYERLRTDLVKKGHRFESETDTEVIVHLISSYLKKGLSPHEATQGMLQKLKGAFALVLLFKQHADLLICARSGSPLAIGLGDQEMFVGSDALALAPFTQKVCYLNDGDWAELSRTGYQIYDRDNVAVQRPVKTTNLSSAVTGKGTYQHFMQKEIFEQPTIMGDILQAYLTNPPSIPRPKGTITIIACGTSFYAAMVAKNWLERIAKIRVEVDIASEFRYRQPPLDPKGIFIFISQSGETADTLAALQYVKKTKQHTIALVNVPESSLARGCDQVIEIKAGPEISVASTKGFTAQLLSLAFLTLDVSQQKPAVLQKLRQALVEVPAAMNEVLASEEDIRQLAKLLIHADSALYVGRGTSYALAMEGALKLKELSYIHAEGYAAGELKHGPIALVEEKTPIVAVAPYDDLFEKTASNIQEILARKGRVIAFTDAEGAKHFHHPNITTFVMPSVHPFITPLVYALPMQLLSYHTAVLKGTDVDQPRNLAKSVTVE